MWLMLLHFQDAVLICADAHFQSFLNDYGLIWVGDSSGSSDSAEGEPWPDAERGPRLPGRYLSRPPGIER